MKNPSKTVLLAISGLLSLYIGSYLFLSLNGRFEPRWLSPRTGIHYAWAPLGFVREYKWNYSLAVAYAPLYAADQQFWHEGGNLVDKRYPIDEITEKNARQFLLAWGLLSKTK